MKKINPPLGLIPWLMRPKQIQDILLKYLKNKKITKEQQDKLEKYFSEMEERQENE